MKIHIAVSHVTKLFTRGAGVTDISCEAHEGEIVGIAGPNGAGKSTLVRIIAGVLTPAEGTVTVSIDGTLIDKDALQDSLGLVAPYLALYDEFTPREMLAVTARLRGIQWTDVDSERLLHDVHLSHAADRIARGFSSGMLQRLRFAVALQHRPPVLLLDEPTSNLDEAGFAMVKSIVDRQREHGVAFIASNDDRELAWCSSMVFVGK